ncbi:uncharacterized protein KQ657_004085 [Scheffersomyces spartinae]|uniref:Rhodanese domain-containing protein n=1 Tax=Scheffersomyces spartinae TaxID=45513 RepID=A0A9P7VBL8_9ASCO|nr:uncharacterized protein KQ657_004085 [Scheffersomyces spartinae]KAG7194974.1 hypothetical protein KQ657_004085 [Scheffersomyces spartinae]
MSILKNKSVLSTVSPFAFRCLLTSGHQGRIIPVDGTWYMPNVPKNGKTQFLTEERLENAAFFDLDKIALPGSKYPHMLPTYSGFKEAMEQLKLTRDDKIVVYDKQGIFSGPRVAWTFALFGHPKVYLLDTYKVYKDGFDYPIETNVVESISTPLNTEAEAYDMVSEAQFNDNYAQNVIEYEELLSLVESGELEKEYITFDARSADRFSGAAPEPRPGLSSGHVPSAKSLPFNKLLQPDGTYKLKEELIELFLNDYGLDLVTPDLNGKKGIIVMCGTGVTAVIIRFAIEGVIGADVPIRVYDGSWTEWAQRAPSEYIVKDA